MVGAGGDPRNLLGACFFLSYILAALVLSIIMIMRINANYKAQAPFSHRNRDAAVFSILSAMSFFSLSFHMLSFLIHSYAAYCERHRLSQGDLQLWDWMSHSSLFEAFANALTASPERWWWAQLDLLLTFHVNLWMSHQRGLSSSLSRSLLLRKDQFSYQARCDNPAPGPDSANILHSESHILIDSLSSSP